MEVPPTITEGTPAEMVDSLSEEVDHLPMVAAVSREAAIPTSKDRDRDSIEQQALQIVRRPWIQTAFPRR